LARAFSACRHVHEWYPVLREARRQGVRSTRLSNSWGNGYPRARLAEVFDALVISGEVGMRKPEPGIFRHALEVTGLPPEQCVFIDDLEHNVRAAAELGMTGILHRTPEETRERLAEACGLRLDPAPS